MLTTLKPLGGANEAETGGGGGQRGAQQQETVPARTHAPRQQKPARLPLARLDGGPSPRPLGRRVQAEKHESRNGGSQAGDFFGGRRKLAAGERGSERSDWSRSDLQRVNRGASPPNC